MNRCFLLWLLVSCQKSEPVTCPAGKAMDAAGECRDIAVSDEEPSPTVEEDSGETEEPLSTEGLERVKDVFPSAAGLLYRSIPEGINTPGDVEHGNVMVGYVVDSDREHLGFVRNIFTPVYCVAGVCEAIQFVMAFGADRRALSVYHPDDIEHRLMKYFDGLYEPFSDDDWVLLNNVFVEPPEVYEGVESVEEMVEGTHGTAPTLPAFQPVAVRGAVFTVWYIIRYGQKTEIILNEMEAENVWP